MSRNSKQMIVGFSAMVVVLAIVATIAIVSNSNKGLRVDVLSARRAEPGEVIDVTISARDTRGVVTSVVVDFDDNTAPATHRRVDCSGAETGATTQSFDFQHAFAERGVYTIRATVTSGCTDRAEETVAVRTVEVKPLEDVGVR